MTDSKPDKLDEVLKVATKADIIEYLLQHMWHRGRDGLARDLASKVWRRLTEEHLASFDEFPEAPSDDSSALEKLEWFGKHRKHVERETKLRKRADNFRKRFMDDVP